MTLVVVTAEDVCDALQQTLRDHLATALTDVGAHASLTAPIPPPRSWGLMTDFAALPDKQSPAVAVTSPGLEDEPGSGGESRMSSSVSAIWRVRAHAVVRAGTYEETARTVYRYAAALRVAVLRHRKLSGDIARTTRWLDEEYDALSVNTQRTIAICAVDFAVTVDSAIDPTT